jgi:hypothetical protein
MNEKTDQSSPAPCCGPETDAPENANQDLCCCAPSANTRTRKVLNIIYAVVVLAALAIIIHAIAGK